MRMYFQEFVQDFRGTLRAFARNRSALAVADLLLLPWCLSIVFRHNLNAWQPLSEVFGIMFLYWFVSRRRGVEGVEVRQPLIETGLALALVLLWMLFRIGQYTSLYHLPVLRVGSIKDIYETIVPKLLEMFLLPLAIWLALRYRPRALGFRLTLRDWLPALIPIAVLVWIGLQNNKPEEWGANLIYFFLGAGLPEEFLFRGILQPRVEALVKNPIWGLYLASFIFGASHLPINLSNAQPSNWISAFESAFTFQLSIGFALGFAYQRVRNLTPLMVLHMLIDAAP